LKNPMGPTPAEIKEKLQKRWDRGVFFHNSEEAFPLEISLGKISSKVMTQGFDELRRWISLYQKEDSLGDFIVWEQVNHRLLGKNLVPRKLLFNRGEDLALFLGHQKQWKRFFKIRTQLEEADSRLLEWADRNPMELLKQHKDMDRLLILWSWMISHPRPGIYLRQIDLPGIDSKFTEGHKKLLSQWLDLTLADEEIDLRQRGFAQFEGRYGFLGKPQLIRFRFLDSLLGWRGCRDLSIPVEDFCGLFIESSCPVKRVFVVENDICGLSFPPLKECMVIFGRGYNFESWKDARWLHNVDLGYWGDLDTHGFCILDQFRSVFPQARSLLMDRRTLLDHEHSWGEEPKPSSADLKRLNLEEMELYDDLRFHRLGKKLRLEQEFIRFGEVEKAVKNCF
jgi:hypothetical protein